MEAKSSPVTSAQTEIHPRLSDLVDRHARSVFRKPILDYNRAGFDQASEAWRSAGSQPLILDAGCGVGWSTLRLASHYPDHFVIGVDQSAHRLGRVLRWPDKHPSNCVRVRADLVDFWRLLHEAGIRAARHYMLYPNPWPKQGQLSRRWHGHPVFPTVVALGGEFECRSNWPVYIQECAAALAQISRLQVAPEPFVATEPMTPFECKYSASGHRLWRCRVRLS
jgi:tRNA (guanine-N7-)-methyltransferase